MLQLTRRPLRFWTASAPVLIIAFIVLCVSAAAPALADWRKELGTFRVGMVEAQGKQYSPVDLDKLRVAYSGALGMPVEIFQAKDYPSLIDAQASSRIEYAFYTAQAYATAYLACECVEPIAAPQGADGSAGIKTALFLDESVDVADLAKSKGIGIAGRDSLSTYGVVVASFRPKGLTLTGAESWLHMDGLDQQVRQQHAGVNLHRGDVRQMDGLFRLADPLGSELHDRPRRYEHLRQQQVVAGAEATCPEYGAFSKGSAFDPRDDAQQHEEQNAEPYHPVEDDLVERQPGSLHVVHCARC